MRYSMFYMRSHTTGGIQVFWPKSSVQLGDLATPCNKLLDEGVPQTCKVSLRRHFTTREMSDAKTLHASRDGPCNGFCEEPCKLHGHL